jgi:hypothetical protein
MVDMHRWYRNKGHGKIARDGSSYELVVHEFSGFLCGCLEDQKQLQASQNRIANEEPPNEELLKNHTFFISYYYQRSVS